MEHHHVFSWTGVFLLIAAIILTIWAGIWFGLAFYLFAIAAALRGASLKGQHLGWRNVSYVLFCLGLIVLVQSFIMSIH